MTTTAISATNAANTAVSALVANPVFLVEPHSPWVVPGQVDITAIATRVYGKPFSALQACAADDDDALPNDSHKLYRLSNDHSYNIALEECDEPRVYLGYKPSSWNQATKEGITQLEYWLSIGWVGLRGATQQDINADANPAAGLDLFGAVFEDEHFAQRYFSPSLRSVLADLIRRGELPRGDFLFHHWW